MLNKYEVTSFLSTDCELNTETCSKNVYSLGPRSFFQYCRSRVSMSSLVFLPILLMSGVNVESGLPSNIVDLGCQCRVWSSFQYCRSRVLMSRLVFFQFCRFRVSMSRLVFLPILSISGVNVASGLSSNIDNIRCQYRVWSSFPYCRSRVPMSHLVFLPILSISGLVFLPIFLISCVNVASGLPSNIVDLGCQCRVWSSFQYC